MPTESIIFSPEIPDRELDREVRKVNDALADAGTINPDMSGGGGLGGGGTRSPMRQISSGVDDLLPMADYRNRLLEDIVDGLGGGGGGDSGGGLFSRISRLFRGGGLLGLLGGGAVALGAIIARKLSDVSLGSIISDKIGSLSPGDLIAQAATVTAPALIAEKASISVGHLISDPVSLGGDALLGALIASPVALTASQLLKHLVDGESGTGSTTADISDTDIPSRTAATRTHAEILADQEAEGEGLVDRVRGEVTDPRNIGAAAGVGVGAAGLAALLATAPISGPAIGAGAATTAGLGYLSTQGAAARSRSPRQSVNDTGRVNVTLSPTYSIDPSGMADLDKQMDQKAERAKEEAKREIERNLTGGGR